MRFWVIVLFLAILWAQPQKAEKHLRRGEELMQIGDFANALGEYETALQYSPFSAELMSTPPTVLGDCGRIGKR